MGEREAKLTPGEFDRLLSEYSAGTISSSDQNRLMQAAMDEQELFDELAEVDELRSVFTDPASVALLRKDLAPAAVRKPIWQRLWPAYAMAAIAALAIVIVRQPAARQSTPVETEVAVARPAGPPEADAIEPLAAPKLATPKPKATDSTVKRNERQAFGSRTMAARAGATSDGAFRSRLVGGLLEVQAGRVGYLYVFGLENGTPKLLEAGTRISAGETRTVPAGGSRELVVALTSLPVPNPSLPAVRRSEGVAVETMRIP